METLTPQNPIEVTSGGQAVQVSFFHLGGSGLKDGEACQQPGLSSLVSTWLCPIPPASVMDPVSLWKLCLMPQFLIV